MTKKTVIAEDSYKGYIAVTLDEVALAEFYQTNVSPVPLFENQYLVIYNEDEEFVDAYKLACGKLQRICFTTIESKALGKIKPKDEIQMIAMDSLKTNVMTMLRGSAGTGKSYLALGYLFEALDKGVIDRIIIFCNTVATAGAAKLGYYPGSREDKLLDSQVGNFLASKLGSFEQVERMVNQEQLLLLPMSDIRGYDTSGLKAGIYIQECQNLDIELMRLALQRIGDDCICILDGDDATQVDMDRYAGSRNGMRRVSEVFKGEDFYGEVTLKNIYRSRIAKVAQKL